MQKAGPFRLSFAKGNNNNNNNDKNNINKWGDGGVTRVTGMTRGNEKEGEERGEEERKLLRTGHDGTDGMTLKAL